MALFRALESSRPAGRRLFRDPLARRFLGPSLALVDRVSAVPVLRGLVTRLIDRNWPGARTSAAARTRFIDDSIRACLENDLHQVVILGAGYDCRAYRLRGFEKVAVFEVDHPDTLRAKREALERALGSLPERVRFVPADFNERLESDLGAEDYRRLYFGQAARSMQGYEFYRIAVARVAEPAVRLAAEAAGRAPACTRVRFL